MTKKQIILAAYVGGVNEHTLWEHPDAGSQIEFSTFKHAAQKAEAGKFDYFFLAEGLALRSRRGEIFDHDIAGRPDTIPVLAAIAAVTEHIGLVGTINATFNEPFELARQFASLDHLSGGRAGWNVVTSFDAFTGANFRRGGFLPHAERYERAEQTVNTVRELWDSWSADAIVADKESGQFLDSAEEGRFDVSTSQFDISGRFTVPRSPQGRPIIVQAGISPQGRDFAAANADVIFSPYSRLEEARDFYADIKGRVEGFGRNRDFSEIDFDGPLPDFDPDGESAPIIEGRAFTYGDRLATVRRWREKAAENGWSIREFARHELGGVRYVGTASQVAEEIDDFVQNEGSDGLVIGSHLTPGGIDEFVDHVVPILQERGSLREEYTGTTLRENLGIPVPERGTRAPSAFAH
uniref:NtaA/DmoA family FMN-dependent monooxygenase n=1 Tax=Pseudoclavibacter sp. RFBI5 TaxID=2080578 RepID=UPI0028006F45|nr:NtaA/DmoA family FMN-dependent monooxygenase [Pseudoclavibacter sp. RFBI5]